MNEKPKLGGFIRELDGLRAVAIGVVMLHHFWPEDGPLARFGRYANLGWVGVDLFFVISGFLIAGILLDTKAGERYYRNFYARRAIRIFPLYYLFVGAVFVVIPLAQGGPYLQTEFVESAGSPLWYLLYVSNIPEAIYNVTPPFVLAPLWSLAIEEQFYLSFPFVVRRLRRPVLAKALLGAVAFSIAFRVVTALLSPENERLQYLATPSRIEELSLGCLLAIAVRSDAFRVTRRQASIALGTALAASVAAFALGGLDRTTFFGRTLGYTVVGLTFATLVLWAVVHRGHRAAAVLRLAPLAYVGKLCYGLYLLHRPVAIVVGKVAERLGLDPDDAPVTMILVKFAASVLVATISWYAFESPLLKLKARFSTTRHPAERARVGVVPTPIASAEKMP